MPELKCIYCLNDIPIDGFNTEHVISRAFGTFKNNPTLTDMVCCACNQFFGDNLELFFARDSFEALDRIKRGLTPPEKIAKFPQQRLTFAAALDGELEGLRLSLIADDGSEAVTLVPQVGLPKRGGAGWTYLTEEELADVNRALPKDFDQQGYIRIIGPNNDVNQRLIGLLMDRGVPFDQKDDFPLPQPEADGIEVYINMKIDPVVKRCIAKYVFNYMAYATNRNFALLPDFNIIRFYIRYGDTPDYPLVVADGKPILAKESSMWRQTNGHLVTLNWTTDKRHVVGQLSLFNRVTYRISLARNFSGLWRQIRSGHHFDLATQEVSPLAVTSLIVPSAG